MGYKDKATQKAYQNAWLQRRRQEWILKQGSKCTLCGRSDLPFEVDHIDKTQKVEHKVWSWSQVRREEELKKCQLLCQQCHWDKTAEENSGRTLVHGTLTGYSYKCRCVECTAVHSAAMAEYHAKVRGISSVG